MRLYTLNFYVFSCSKRDERLTFAEAAALSDQYPIRQTGVARGPTAKKGVLYGLRADIGENAGRREADRLVYDMQDEHGVNVHDIRHDPLVPSSILGTNGDAEEGRPRLDSLAVITALRYVPKYLERLRRRIRGASLP